VRTRALCVDLHRSWIDGDKRGAVAREARDTLDARGLNGFGEGQIRQDGGEAAGQHRCAQPSAGEQEKIMVSTPALR